MRDRDRPRVGEILLQAGVIDSHQLRAALGEQARWGRPLGATLVKLGFVEENELVRALASQLGLPMAILDGKRIPADVLALVPKEVAEREMVIPLFVKQEGGRRVLHLGVEDPGNLAAFDDLAFRTGMDVKLVMVGPSELCEAIDRCYNRAAEASRSASNVPVVAPGSEELARHWSRAGSDTSADDTTDSMEAAVALAPDVSEAMESDHPEDDARALSADRPPPSMPVQTAPAPAPAPSPSPGPTAPAPPAAPLAAAPVQSTATASGDTSPISSASIGGAGGPAAESAGAPGGHGERDVTGSLSAAFAATAARPVAAPRVAAPAPDDRTPLILRALAELLIDKGVITREELQIRVRDLDPARNTRG